MPPFFVYRGIWIISKVRPLHVPHSCLIAFFLSQIGTGLWSAVLQQLNRFETGFEQKLDSLNQAATTRRKRNSFIYD